MAQHFFNGAGRYEIYAVEVQQLLSCLKRVTLYCDVTFKYAPPGHWLIIDLQMPRFS